MYSAHIELKQSRLSCIQWPIAAHEPFTCNVELLFIVEISKAVDMYMFLFDDILLLTKVKKPPRKVGQPWFVCLSLWYSGE